MHSDLRGTLQSYCKIFQEQDDALPCNSSQMAAYKK